jgi:hypothetical protein
VVPSIHSLSDAGIPRKKSLAYSRHCQVCKSKSDILKIICKHALLPGSPKEARLVRDLGMSLQINASVPQGRVEYCKDYISNFFGAKWHSLRSLPFQGPKQSRFSGPPPPPFL